jgi:hypothetical protein
MKEGCMTERQVLHETDGLKAALARRRAQFKDS